MGPTWPRHSCCSSCFATPFHAFITTSFSLLLMLHCSSSYFAIPSTLLFLLSCFVVPLCALLFLFVFRYSYYYFVAPFDASLLLYVLPLFLLCCSSPCFIAPPALLGCYSSCLIVAPCFASLLLIVFRYYPLCFVVVLVLVLLCGWLLLLLCYSCCFAIAWCVATPPHFAILMPSQVPLCPLLLRCPLA